MEPKRKETLPAKSKNRREAKVYFRWLSSKFNHYYRYWDNKSKQGVLKYIRSALERYSSLRLNNLASSLAYYLFFALVPFILFVTSMFARFGRGLFNHEAIENLSRLMPEPILNVLRGLIRDLSQGVSVSASIGIVALIWSASRGFIVMAYAMDLVYGNRNNTVRFFVRQVVSVLLTVLVAASLLLVLSAMTFGESIIIGINRLLNLKQPTNSWLSYLGYGFSLLYLILLFSLLYFFCSKRRAPYRYSLLFGSIVALLWVFLSVGFSFYLRSSTKYSVIYGSITGIIFLLLWLYLCALLLLMGALAHNEVIKHYLDLHGDSNEQMGEAKI